MENPGVFYFADGIKAGECAEELERKEQR